MREFFFLWVLGMDLAGAVTLQSADAGEWPPPTHLQRFDRLPDGSAVHMEDFAQVCT